MSEDKYTSLELSKKLADAGCKLEGGEYQYDWKTEKHYWLFDIMNDICVKYATQFFGTTLVCSGCGGTNFYSNGYCANEYCGVDGSEMTWGYHPKKILELMQQGKKQEVEDYIWENTIFNKERHV